MIQSATLSVNEKRYFHRFSKKEIEVPLNLLDWIQSQKESVKMYWLGRDGEEIAAVGSVLDLLEVPVFDLSNESPAFFFGGHAFFPEREEKDLMWKDFPKIRFFLPKLLLSRKNGILTCTTNSINSLLEEVEIFPPSMKTHSSKWEDSVHLPAKPDWKNLVEKSLEKMQASLLEKVVLARRTTKEGQIDPFTLLAKLPKMGAISFALQFREGSTFIGTTPERLYKRDGSHLETEAVAGTRKRGETQDEDEKLTSELLEDAKEKSEFAFVKKSIEESLSPLCKQLQCLPEDTVLQTPRVQHLHNVYEAALNENTTDAKILKALHPTAAMGGTPRTFALEHIYEEEPFERGWYAAPLGYCSQEKAEFAVGIRSALCEKNAIHFFAGTGIVEASDPEKEWDELQHKISHWSSV